jgi:hypothetical protein
LDHGADANCLRNADPGLDVSADTQPAKAEGASAVAGACPVGENVLTELKSVAAIVFPPAIVRPPLDDPPSGARLSAGDTPADIAASNRPLPFGWSHLSDRVEKIARSPRRSTRR